VNDGIQEAMDLEKFLRPWKPEQWRQDGCPEKIVALAIASSEDGYSTGVGKCDKGWFMLVTGQGPSLVEAEWWLVNHEEAIQLAYLKRAESNLARCYIELYNKQKENK
jgi:hypothetical protein